MNKGGMLSTANRACTISEGRCLWLGRWNQCWQRRKGGVCPSPTPLARSRSKWTRAAKAIFVAIHLSQCMRVN